MRKLLMMLTLLGVLGFTAAALAADQPQAEKNAKPQAEKKDTEKTEDKSDSKAESKEQADKGDQPATFKVEQKPLKIEVTLDGIFEAEQTREIAVRMDEWNQLTVDWAIEHGRRVKKGAELLRFDTRKIDIARADLETELESAKLALQKTEASLELLEKSVPESLAAARRTASESSENLERFHQREKADMIKDVEQNLKQTKRALSYQQEELKQLERMYKADDLTEETEEIVLIRARHRVQAFEYMLEKARKRKELFHAVTLPRYEANLMQVATQTKLGLEKAEDTLPATLTETRLSLEKMQTDLRRKKEKLRRLRRDRDEFTVVAPADGIVYYGQAVRGKWPSVTTVAKMLSRGAAVKPKQVVMTIVKNDDLFVRSTVDEKQLHQVKRGAKATVAPAAFPKLKLKGRVDRVSSIPIAPGKFGADISLADTRQINAGMGCKVAILVAKNKKAIMVPSSAVKQGEDGEKGYVYIVKANDRRKKKTVRIGHTQDDNLEIVSGLKAGDTILKKNPDQ
ncbi:MAG: efflux RND transporter periplasmic adaptor subunit [Planctomycetota bacterium]|nr:efflux RND transporter periplasmic adaptor subunit [Planctomycetota bacterium]